MLITYQDWLGYFILTPTGEYTNVYPSLWPLHAAIAMRNNKMNKTWLFTTLTLALVAAAPAHAISAKYREQLERSGCTQMTDGTTCDIHKTKAENAAAAQHASSGFAPWVGTWYVYTEYGDKIDEITVTAKTVKTHGHLAEAAKASQGKLTFRVKSSAFTLNDAFNGVWANGSQRGTLQKVL